MAMMSDYGNDARKASDAGNGNAVGGGTASLLKWQQEKLRKENKMAAPFCDKIHVSYKGMKRVEISYLY